MVADIVVRALILLPSAEEVIAASAGGSGSSAQGGTREPNVSHWSWLGENGGTYWYVPVDNLQAIQWSPEAPSAYTSLDDQTVWHIERYDNGYFFGSGAAEFAGYPRTCQYLIGSVTPEGQVYISFTAVFAIPVGDPSITTGVGKMVQQDGKWTFNMQMASGSSSSQVSHWAYMLQCTPKQSCWTDLPGVDQTIPQLLASCSIG